MLRLVEPTNSTVGQLIASATIDRVPLLVPQRLHLIQLSAGVTPPNGPRTPAIPCSRFRTSRLAAPESMFPPPPSTVAIVGSVYYMLDGSPIGVAENNAAAIIPAMNIPEDGVDEVRVETQNTPASYQSGAAGVISLVSKSGTNRFHGDVFGVFRPERLISQRILQQATTSCSNGLSNTPP